MIENYAEKKEKKFIELQRSDNGNIAIIEKQYHPTSGQLISFPAQETNSKHLGILLRYELQQLALAKRRVKDIRDLNKDIIIVEKNG